MTTPIANVEAAAAWDGEEGERWAGHAGRYDASIRRHHRALLVAAAIQPRDRVLDLGCGCGTTAIDAARAAHAGNALGVDLSSPMLRLARERAQAAGVENVLFERADAQVHPFEPGSFDVVLSRYGASFFGDLPAAWANVARACRPGARVAVLSWQALRRNEWLTVLRDALAAGRVLPEPPAGAPGPFGLADPEATRRILEDAGFRDVHLDEVDLPVELGRDAEDAFSWARTLGITKGLLEDLDEGARASALERLRTALARLESPEGVLAGSGSWLVTAVRR